jgi:hypothetical protein
VLGSSVLFVQFARIGSKTGSTGRIEFVFSVLGSRFSVLVTGCSDGFWWYADAGALERVSEKARRRIAHPSPHDTASGAVWDGSVVQKASDDEWNGMQTTRNRLSTYGMDQTRPNSLGTLRAATTPSWCDTVS